MLPVRESTKVNRSYDDGPCQLETKVPSLYLSEEITFGEEEFFHASNFYFVFLQQISPVYDDTVAAVGTVIIITIMNIFKIKPFTHTVFVFSRFNLPLLIYYLQHSLLKKHSVPSVRLPKSKGRIALCHTGFVYELITLLSGMLNADTGVVLSWVFKHVYNIISCLRWNM